MREESEDSAEFDLKIMHTNADDLVGNGKLEYKDRVGERIPDVTHQGL